MKREHVRIRSVLGRADRRITCHKLRLVQDEIVDADEQGSGGVEVVDGDHVLVVVGPRHRLVRKMVRIRDRVEVEGPSRIVAGRYGDKNIVGVDVDDRREPSPTVCVEGDLRVGERMARDAEEAVQTKSASDKRASLRVDDACSVDHREDMVRSCTDSSIRWSAAARIRRCAHGSFKDKSYSWRQRSRGCRCRYGLRSFVCWDESIRIGLVLGLLERLFALGMQRRSFHIVLVTLAVLQITNVHRAVKANGS